jgi:hypothetical protein
MPINYKFIFKYFMVKFTIFNENLKFKCLFKNIAIIKKKEISF